jgi:hypothetical protein
MHSLQTLQGIEQRQINRNRGALKKGATAPFSFAWILDPRTAVR